MLKGNNIRIFTIILDMGDILYDATKWRKWLYQYLKKKKEQFLKYQGFIKLWDEKFLNHVHRGEIEYTEAFNQFLKCLKFNEKEIKLLNKVIWIKKKEIEMKIKPFSGVRFTLKKLKEMGKIICILTDSESNEISIRRGILKEKLHINQYIDYVVSSIDIKSRKPEKVTYLYCVEKSLSQIKNTIFVGHDQDELDGAKDTGIRTVAFNYIDDVNADYKIKNFKDLLDILR